MTDFEDILSKILCKQLILITLFKYLIVISTFYGEICRSE